MELESADTAVTALINDPGMSTAPDEAPYELLETDAALMSPVEASMASSRGSEIGGDKDEGIE